VKGQIPEALENVSLAASIQQEEAARYPDNPDFPRQTVFFDRVAGNYKAGSKDFTGALASYARPKRSTANCSPDIRTASNSPRPFGAPLPDR
jgi:hypothetical protein